MMPDVKVVVDKTTSAALHKLALEFPREVYRGIGSAGAAMRGKLRKAMKNSGGEGVPQMAPWNRMTPLFNPRRTKLGGRLAESYAIQMYKKGKGALTVGFISPLARYAEELQEEDTRAFSTSERYILHRNLGPQIPTIYSRPSRPIIAPFAEEQNQHFGTWCLRAAQKAIDKTLLKRAS